MPKPRPVLASAATVAKATDKANALLEHLLKQAFTDGQRNAQGDAPTVDPVTRDALLGLIAGLAGRATYRVYVGTALESHRITYWTTIVSSNFEPGDPFRRDGRITPFMTETLEHALYEADSWAAFLGVEAEPWAKPDWHDEQVAVFAARALETGQGSGSVPEVGARLEENAQEQGRREARAPA